MGRCAHRPCCLWFVHLHVRLTKPPQTAVRAGWSPAAPTRRLQAAAVLRPAAIDAGFVRLAAGRTRIRPAGARGLTGRRRPQPPDARPARTKKRDSCSKNAVWERMRGSELRDGFDGGAVSWGNAQALRSGRRLRGEKPPPGAPGTPRFRPRPQFLNTNGRIWVQPRPPRRGGRPGPDSAPPRAGPPPVSCDKKTPTRNRTRPAGSTRWGAPGTGRRPPWSKPAFAVGTENAGFDHASGHGLLSWGFAGRPKRPAALRGGFPGRTGRFTSSERRF